MIFMWFASDHDNTLKPLELYTTLATNTHNMNNNSINHQ